MHNYTLELLADNTPEARQKSCEEIIKHANNFCTKYHANHPKSTNDSTIKRLFQDMTQGAFWRMLYAIDGLYDDDAHKNKEKREWGKKNFDLQELQEILNICANYATLAPVKENWPGTYRGHKILYEELLKKENSIFRGAVNPIQKQRINNGRFWEMLPDMRAGINNGEAYFIVEDVLLNNFEDLTTKFAPKGFEILQRNSYNKELYFDLNSLSNKGIDKYVEFIKQIDQDKEKLNLHKADIAKLIKPYILASIQYTDEAHFNPGPRFPQEKLSNTKSFIERLQDPIIADYIANCKETKNALIKELTTYATHILTINHAREALNSTPNPKEIFKKMIEQMPEHSIGRFVKYCAKLENKFI